MVVSPVCSGDLRFLGGIWVPRAFAQRQLWALTYFLTCVFLPRALYLVLINKIYFFIFRCRTFLLHVMYVYHVCAVLQRSEEDLGSPVIRGTDICKLQYKWESNLSPLKEQAVFLTVEPSPQAITCFLDESHADSVFILFILLFANVIDVYNIT